MPLVSFFLFNDTPTTEIYTLSLHDALPISCEDEITTSASGGPPSTGLATVTCRDRKSTRLNSSHPSISYAVFCLKKKKAENVAVPAVNIQDGHELSRDDVGEDDDAVTVEAA